MQKKAKTTLRIKSETFLALGSLLMIPPRWLCIRLPPLGPAKRAVYTMCALFAKNTMKKHMRAVLHATVKKGEKASRLGTHLIFMTQDGGKPGLHPQFQSPFVHNQKHKMPLSTKKFGIQFEHESVLARYKRITLGFHTAFEEEKCVINTEAALELPIRERKWHSGDNRSSNLYPVKLDCPEPQRSWR